ncbi:MAG: phage major tail protein, TP901-1 family [Sphingomonadales bacterium]
MAEKGSAFLLKAGDGGPITELFTTVAGLRSTSFTINGETVDVTTKDSAGWRELLDGAGVTSMSISGSGVFQDNSNVATLRAAAISRSLNNYEIVFESGDKYTGSFQVGSVEQGGEHNGEVTYSVSLESSGPVTFTAV